MSKKKKKVSSASIEVRKEVLFQWGRMKSKLSVEAIFGLDPNIFQKVNRRQVSFRQAVCLEYDWDQSQAITRRAAIASVGISWTFIVRLNEEMMGR